MLKLKWYSIPWTPPFSWIWQKMDQEWPIECPANEAPCGIIKSTKSRTCITIKKRGSHVVVAVERAVKKPQEEAHKEKNIWSQEKEQSPPTNSSTDRKRRHSNPFSLTTEIERNFLLECPKSPIHNFQKKSFKNSKKKKKTYRPSLQGLKKWASNGKWRSSEGAFERR